MGTNNVSSSKNSVPLKKLSSSSRSARSEGSQKPDSEEKAQMRLRASKAAAQRLLGGVTPEVKTSRAVDMHGGVQRSAQSDDPPLPRPGQTFGRYEGPKWKTMAEFIEDSFTDPIYACSFYGARPEVQASMLQRLEELGERLLVEPGIGAHPKADDPTVRYSVIDWPRSNGTGTEKLTMRWWSGGKVGYYLDIVDTRRGTVCKPPNGFSVSIFRDGSARFIPTQESVMLKFSPDMIEKFKRNSDGHYEERWVVPSGCKVLIYCKAKKIARMYAPVADDEVADEIDVPEYEVKKAELFH